MIAAGIHHHRQGSGEPLVLLHGVGHHWQAWRPVLDRLGPSEFEVVACDTPGLGASPALPDGVKPTVQACADAFEAFFDELGLDQPHVAGNSMGGALALELARRGAVRSATAFSPAGFWNPLERRWCQAALSTLAQTPAALRPGVARVLGAPQGRRALAKVLFRWPERVTTPDMDAALHAAWDAAAFPETLAAFDDYTFARGDELRGTPVTVAWGRYDVLLPFWPQAGRARRALPWARHVVLGTGHLPYADDPAAVAATLRLGAGRS